MAVRDIVVLNTTSSRLEAQQSSDTVRITGTSDQLLSIENSSGTSIFSIDSPSGSVSITGNLTASGDFSASLGTVSSSFGRIEATTLVGSAANLTNTDWELGIVSSSQQIASEISGAFDSGFEFTGNIGKAVGVWSAGAAMNTATNANAGAGTRNAALSFGGSPDTNATEEYNGSVWSAANDLITGRYYLGSAGYLTSALAIGGESDYDDTEKYDGTAWSETGNLITGRNQHGATGTQNAAVVFGGSAPGTPSPYLATCTETFNGSTWSEVSNLITGLKRMGSAGTQNAALAYGSQPTCACTEEWDGGSWSTGGNLLTGATGMAGGGVTSTVNAAISIGGSEGTKQCVEEYNGTSWSVGGLLISGRNDFGAGGSQDSIVAFGGCVSSPWTSTCTEEYDGYLPVSASFGKLVATTFSADASQLDNTDLAGTISSSAQIATDISGSFDSGFEFTGTIGKGLGAWSNGPNLLQNQINGAGVGLQNAALAIAGGVAPSAETYSCTMRYNGTAWGSAGSIGPTVTIYMANGAFGTYTSAVTFGGPSAPYGKTATWDGSAWSAGPNMDEGKLGSSGIGTFSAGLAAGGNNPDCTPSTNIGTEEWNGSTWSEGGTMIGGASYGAATGTQNAGLWYRNTSTEEYDGSTWASGGTVITSRFETQGTSTSGTQNATFFAGGSEPAVSSCTEEYNGTSWTVGNALPSVRRLASGAGTNDAGLVFGGCTPAATNTTVQYDGYLPVSASFGKLCATKISGDGSTLSNTLSPGVVSSSAQLATDISGSFDEGFQFTGTIGTTIGAWAAGGALITRKLNASGTGLQNAALSFGGQNPSQQCTEHYNGTAWSSGGTPANGCYGRAAGGTEYAGIVIGGYHPAPNSTATEEYYGETFAAGGALSTGRGYLGGGGTQNAAFAFGGFTPTAQSVTEEYNGTSWSSGGSMINTRGKTAGAGAQNAGLAVGGYNPTNLSATEHYDGSSWSAGGAMNTARKALSVTGVENDALRVGGQPGTATEVEHYDGSAWSVGGSLNESRWLAGAAAGTRTAGLYFGGGNPGTGDHAQCTEEYTSYISSASFGIVCAATVSGDASRIDNIISPNLVSGSTQLATDISGSWDEGFQFTGTISKGLGAWTLVAPLPRATRRNAGAGVQHAALSIGGYQGSPSPARCDCTDHYDGAAWAAGGSIGIGTAYARAIGTENAALSAGGYAILTGSLEYNGSAWSSGGTMITSYKTHAMAGSQNAGLIFGGDQSPNAKTEEYNGTAWSAGGDMITGRQSLGGDGSQNAAIAMGGGAPAISATCTELYNGTAWAASSASPTNRDRGDVVGDSSKAASFGGGAPSGCTTFANEFEGGTQTWSELSNMNSGRCDNGAAGNGAAALAMGGTNTLTPGAASAMAATEEYNESFLSGSFGRIVATSFTGSLYNVAGDASQLTNSAYGTNVVSSSAQLATDISGSFDSGFEFTGTIGTRIGAWSVGGTLPRENGSHAGAGLQNAALSLGGHPAACTEVLHYNGTAWSAGGALSIARRSHFGDGTEYAALVAGGEPSEKVNTEEYYGETWAAGGNLITGRFGIAGGGTQNSSFGAGGRSSEGNPLSCTEEYDGSTWSAGGALATGQNYGAGTGTQNAGLFSAGTTSPYGTQEYDGTAWSEGAASITPRRSNDIVGLQNAASLFGGYKISPAGSSDDTEEYDGSAWSVGGSLINARYENRGAGTRTSGLTFGDSGGTTSTEHYDSYIASASFGRVDASAIAGSGTGLTNSMPEGALSSSYQIERDISGSFLYGVDGLTGTIGTATGVWSTGTDLNTVRSHGHGAGTFGAGLVSGGKTPSIVANTEEWNGSTWSESGDLITARSTLNGSTGTQGSALMAGSGTPAGANRCTEEYNGTSWAVGGSGIANRNVGTGFGTQNAAVHTNNYQNPTLTHTELYNGTAWAVGARPTFHNGVDTDHAAGAGTQNAGLMFAGRVAKTNTEHFDGTSWSRGGSLSTGKSYANGSGVQNAALTFGGTALSSPDNPKTEEYDGSVWSSGGNMISGVGSMNTFGTLDCTLANKREYGTQEYSSYHTKTGASYFNHISATSASIESVSGYSTNYYQSGSTAYSGSVYGTMLSGSGELRNKLKRNKQNEKLEVKRSFQMPIFYTDPVTGSAGEIWYNAVDNALKFTYNYNAWSAGGNLILGRTHTAAAGTQNAGLLVGGRAPSHRGETEEYDGSTWSESGDLITARSQHAAAGSQNAAIVAGGYAPTMANTEEFNGSTWAAGGALSTARYGPLAAGSQNATAVIGGYNKCTLTELYNGSTWAAGGALGTGRHYGAAAGSVNATLAFGGSNGTVVSGSEAYDGSAWSATNELNVGRFYLGGAGTQNAAVAFHGETPTKVSCTEEYNGTSWSVGGAAGIARSCLGGAGSQGAALAAGGNTDTDATEEYSVTYVKTVCLDS